MDDNGPLADDPPPPPALKRRYDIELPKRKIPGEPDRYRLPATQIIRKKSQAPPEPVCFRFRSRIIWATSTPVHRDHPNVWRLRLDPSPTQRLIRLLVHCLPVWIRTWAEFAFPEWFLPTGVILKRERQEKDAEEGLFDTEIRAYNQLQPLQGIVVPVCYGQTRYKGARALMLQDVGGVSLAEPAGATLEFDQFSRLLQECFRALHGLGVNPEDPQLGNFILVDGRIVAVDLEMVSFDRSPDENASFMASEITWMASMYQRIRASLRREGLLKAA
ncbi:hypothetical protein QQX98_012605 [Neonectria punicea]|uniref:Aminoglycoside phosphotransferase domain-containing protein n=1 Tax=Neonectria punicea TaxID=979145 RepID=A0ABR1GIQ5_9HYPO